MAERLIRESTVEELLELIDWRARYYLGISGEEFMRRYREGELEDAPVEGGNRFLTLVRKYSPTDCAEISSSYVSAGTM